VSDRGRQPYLIAAAMLAVAIAAAVGLVVGYQVADDDRVTFPAEDSVDAGFARDMSVHHAQAVEMSLIVRDNTDDDAVRTIAYDIATTQQQQIGQMYAWLDLWQLPQHSSEPAMAWMRDGTGGHDMTNMAAETEPTETGSLMPGMATSEEMDQLRAARGQSAEILFLQLMIRHHLGGIEMAEYAMEHADVEQVRDLAETMVLAQESEVDAMNDLLVERGAEPIERLDQSERRR
jgi:uncharacterized protein (DUF305 family)